ncbi:MAG: class II fructose-bisphosphate aldolase [Kiritimatiellae bacterium]|nr:class II fructose-bisphosphate aldolase [Kiritimatiellia bacterium]
MPLVNTKDIFAKARAGGYGVFSVIGGNLEMTIGPLRAAEELRSPLIFVFNPGLVPAVTIELGVPMLVNAAQRASVPVVVALLDRSEGEEAAKRALACGASSIMFDGSTLDYEQNVARTRRVVDLAHAAGACVEGKLGSVARAGDAAADPPAAMTDPKLAADFVARAGPDSLAISFGNVYGAYDRDADLDFDRVRQIRAGVDVPLVMHGGSGLAPEQYRKLIDCGITRFCYYTAIAKAASRDLRAMSDEAGDGETVYHEHIERAIEYFYKETKKLIGLLGCGGK